MTSVGTVPEKIVLPSGEESEGSPEAAIPTTKRERIFGIDVLRGVALLGILVANIEDFAIPEATHDIPIGMPKPAFVGPHAHLHLIIAILKWMFIEGKMRGLFSMLFGAGVIMITSRAERRGAGNQVADIFLRRNMWLVLFGILHATFIWHGDILFTLGLTALLFLYPLRKLKPRTFVLSVTLITVFFATPGSFSFLGGLQDFTLSRQAEVIEDAQKAGKTLTPEQQQIKHAWDDRVKSQTITQESIDASMATTHEGYLSGIVERVQFLYVGPPAASLQLFFLADALGAMMIGMGLFKTGFLSGESSYVTYIWTAIIGFGLTVPIYVLGIWKAYLSGFYFLTTEKWVFAPYSLKREVGSIAIASVVLIVVKSGALRWLQSLLAAVGKTALSNYLLTSVLCQSSFYGGRGSSMGSWNTTRFTILFLRFGQLISR